MIARCPRYCGFAVGAGRWSLVPRRALPWLVCCGGSYGRVDSVLDVFVHRLVTVAFLPKGSSQVDLRRHDFHGKCCFPKVNNGIPAVDQGIPSNPTRDSYLCPLPVCGKPRTQPVLPATRSSTPTPLRLHLPCRTVVSVEAKIRRAWFAGHRSSDAGSHAGFRFPLETTAVRW